MFIIYIFLIIITLIIAIYLGSYLSKNVYHPTLLIFFWVLYIASLITIINMLGTVFFYNTLRNKRGLVGDIGPVGETGDSGDRGVCDIDCKNSVCVIDIINRLNNHYKDLLEKSNSLNVETLIYPRIENRNIINPIKNICGSSAYKEISKVKTVKVLNDYIYDIYQTWITMLVEADKSKGKNMIRNYLETDGLDEEPNLSLGKNNPFREIEKYDIYYWGSDRVFHPRILEYCNNPAVNKRMPQNPPPIMSALRTNVYKEVYSIRRFGSSNKPFSVFRVEPSNHKGKIYYPLGDIITSVFQQKSNKKFIENFGYGEKARTEFPVSFSGDGPVEPTLLLNGSSSYMIPPQDWTMVWRNQRVKSRDRITIWKPKDYFHPEFKKWYRGLGFLVMNNWDNLNPRRQYGFNTPDRQPIRLIVEDLLIDLKGAGFNEVWNDIKTNGIPNVSIWKSADSEYLTNQNIPILITGYNKPDPQKVKMYKLDIKFLEETYFPPIEFKNDLVDEKQVGIGYHGTPEREEKYSVFTWLGTPIETQLTNLGNADKIFARHSGLNKINSYVLLKQKNQRARLEKSLAIVPENKMKDGTQVSDDNQNNPNDVNQLWQMICIDKNGNLLQGNKCTNTHYFIKSNIDKKFLKARLDGQDLSTIFYTTSNLPQKNNPNYKKLIQEYIWYRPQSAMGNKILR